jgi:hypothetical protein
MQLSCTNTSYLTSLYLGSVAADVHADIEEVKRNVDRSIDQLQGQLAEVMVCMFETSWFNCFQCVRFSLEFTKENRVIAIVSCDVIEFILPRIQVLYKERMIVCVFAS